MKKSLPVIAAGIVISFACTAQTDSLVTLQEVSIKAFEQNKHLKEVTAAVNYIGQQQLERFNNTSVLPALNSTPGVRMEERSPGSYRMNIRGSTLRSPFGVRNVKIYWNDIPLTDPGGNTYLNQLSFYNFNSIEIIKGPGSSLYGSGSGGVMLINSISNKWAPGIDASFTAGSFGLLNLNTQVSLGNDDRRNILNYAHLESDGYRNHTRMRRDLINWETFIRNNEKQELKVSMLYGDLYYQTPGGLTKAEYDANAKMARPKAGTLPGADSAKAAIYQKTFLAGASNTFRINGNWENTTVVYGAFTHFKNPTFRAYEKRTEPHFGGRTAFKWKKNITAGRVQLLFGAEAQRGFFNTKSFTNVNGNLGAVQTDDDIDNTTWFVFTQADVQLKKDWNITTGASINRSSVRITRLSVPSFVPVRVSFNSEWAPRLAVSKRVIKQTWVYASISKGFSPPTTAELLPGTVTINTTLQPEEGTNYEAGIKSSWLNNRLYTELNVFSFKLSNAIVVRKDASNANYYVNAGGAKEKGIEWMTIYQPVLSPVKFIHTARVQFSFTHNHFIYSDFKQGTADYSGKKLPSVSPNTLAIVLDAQSRPGIYINLTYYYSDKLPLNDANTFFTSSYSLMGSRIGWKNKAGKKVLLNIFAGADNLFDTKYSLGNDINAAGDRYYNVAAGRNYYAGVALKWVTSPAN